MNEHDGWVASPDLPMLYLHFIVVYLKCVEACSNYRYQWYKTCGGIFEFFKGDNQAVSVNSQSKRRLNLTGLLNDRSYIDAIKSFPINYWFTIVDEVL